MMTTSQIIELAVLIAIVALGIILILVCRKKVAAVTSDCEIHKKKELKGHIIEKKTDKKQGDEIVERGEK